jgi:hypothetical protein
LSERVLSGAAGRDKRIILTTPDLTGREGRASDSGQALKGTRRMWSSPKGTKVEERLERAAEAKKALLERFRSAPKPGDAEYEAQQAKLKAIAEERRQREELRAKQKAAEDARRAEEARLKAEREAEEARIAAEKAAREAAEEAALMAALKAEEEEKQQALLAEQKAARDARYAARKSAKKERRRGY